MYISSNMFFGACALILLGLHFEAYQIDAWSFSDISECNYVVENQLTDHVIKHPKRHICFSWPKPKRVLDLAPPFKCFTMFREGLRTEEWRITEKLRIIKTVKPGFP